MSRKLTDATVDEVKNQIYESVGYGRPPKDSQFKKGQSGNPTGRPKRAIPPISNRPHKLGKHSADMERVLLEPVRAREGGKVRLIAKGEAIRRQKEKIAFGGGILATLRIEDDLKAIDEKMRMEEQDIDENNAFWLNYLINRQIDLDRAKELGTPPPTYPIDPEDIIFVPGKYVRTRGATTAEDIPLFERARRYRDVFICEQVYSTRPGHGVDQQVQVKLRTAWLGSFESHLSHADYRAGQKLWDDLGLEIMVSERSFMRIRESIYERAGFVPTDEPLRVPAPPHIVKMAELVWARTTKEIEAVKKGMAGNSKPKRYRASS